MAFFKLTLAYDGFDFSGWQSQPGRRTVQSELERACREITGDEVRTTAAGRTDAGVHAAGQVVGIESPTRLSCDALRSGLNAKLPPDAAVCRIEAAPEKFHATTDAKRKHYRYTIYNDPRRPIFCRRYAWHVPTVLDVDAMQRGASALVGTHDFVSFQSAGSERESTVRTIFSAEVATGRAGQGTAHVERAVTEVAASEVYALVTIDVEGDGFLYNMVRTIAGSLMEVGRGRREPEWLAEIMAAHDRTAAGPTAPPHGLTLMRVDY